jgi:DNA-binding transcriptional ArsR family regulator
MGILTDVKRDTESDLNAVLKALSNETRLQILEWLKDPRASFGSQEVGDFDEDGVCLTQIQRKSGLSQSTTSHFLAVLARAGLVRSKRVGQWTYFKRDEEAIRRFAGALAKRIGG